jgi:hypothetical protein
MRKRLFCSSHAVLRLRRERALEKVNEVRLNGNPSLRPAAIITPSRACDRQRNCNGSIFATDLFSRHFKSCRNWSSSFFDPDPCTCIIF